MRRTRRRIIIGIGGNIGAGKTTASKQLMRMGAHYLSADRIGWDVLNDIAPSLVRKFGKKILDENQINRRKLRRLVFQDLKAVEYLNRLSHSRLITKIKNALRREQGVVVLDAALLFQWPDMMSVVDYPVLVTASRDVKARRAIKRGFDLSTFYRILDMQMRDTVTARMARYIAINCSTKHALSDQCRKIYKEIINDRTMQ